MKPRLQIRLSLDYMMLYYIILSKFMPGVCDVILDKGIVYESKLPHTTTLPIYQLVINWTQYQLCTLKVWEFFLVYLFLLQVAS